MIRFMIAGVALIALAGAVLIGPTAGLLTAGTIKTIEITVKNTTDEPVMIYVDCRYVGRVEANRSATMVAAAELRSPIKVAAQSSSDEMFLRVRHDNRGAYTWIVSH